jgi:hypothetical protein
MRAAAGLGLVTIAVAVVLAGCAAGAPRPTPQSSTPTTHIPAPPLARLVASADGLGPITLERPMSSAAVSLGLVRFAPTDCVGDTRDDGYTIAAGDRDAGGWEANYPRVHEPFGAPWPFSITTYRDTQAGAPLDTRTSEVAEIGIWDEAIRTPTGVGMGSTLVQLTAAYPAVVHAVQGDASDVYVVSGSPGDIWFEIEGNDPAYWMNNNQGRVLWMTIVPHGSEPFAIAATSGGAYPCPVE